MKLSETNIMLSMWIILVLALVGGSNASQSPLERLCDGSSIELNTVAHLGPIIESIKAGQGSTCSDAAKQSILDLEPIVKSENVCSIEVATKIGQYYQKYVSLEGEFYRQLPKPVKKFYLASGLMISMLCEKSLRARLLSVSRERISREDAKVVKKFNVGSNYLVEHIIGHKMLIQNLFIVTDMDGLISHGLKSSQTFGHGDTISVSLEIKEKFDRIKKVCHNKFKPIYDKLITPLVILTNIGFDYTDDESIGEHSKENFMQTVIYRNWIEAVFVCEMTLKQKIIAIPDSKIDHDSGESTVTILDDKDLAELKRETGLSFSDEPELAGSIEEYTINVRLDESIDLESDELRKAVNSFSKKRKEANGIRKKLWKRFMRNAEQVIDSNQLQFGLAHKSDSAVTDSRGSNSRMFKKKHWKKRALVWLAAIGALIGCAPGLWPLLLVSILILLALGAVRLFSFSSW